MSRFIVFIKQMKNKIILKKRRKTRNIKTNRHRTGFVNGNEATQLAHYKDNFSDVLQV